MPKNEDGEYELILGNSQLVGVFFIVIVLVGVFFAMGYLMGRNSNTPVVADAGSHKPEAKPLVVDAPASAPTRDTDPAASDPNIQRPISTQTQNSDPVPVQSPKASIPAKPVSLPSGQPPPGTYLQLSATTQKTEAELMVDVLRTKKFPAMLAEIPELPGTYRVLVGPLADADVNQTRTDLQNASLPGKIAIKKTF